MSPEELDIADSEYVEKLDDKGRYVVSPGGSPPKIPKSIADRADASERRGDHRTESESSERLGRDAPASPEAARTLLAEELARSKARYGLDIVGHFEGETVRHRTVSDDVIATFENLVRWYAGHVTDGTPPDEVVDILLRESTFETAETPNLAKLLERHDLDRTDSIDDLVAAIREESTLE
ncbi:flagella cluster protein [Natronomonas salsuginis]|uniref:Flagella cluster protein n=1 Tax=Natronomonas salsuginis TaxID=2217661 RepID=A0A4U5JDX4_9EURY|nr:flagella cluster protein [Natronomonas salsuginis]